MGAIAGAAYDISGRCRFGDGMAPADDFVEIGLQLARRLASTKDVDLRGNFFDTAFILHDLESIWLGHGSGLNQTQFIDLLSNALDIERRELEVEFEKIDANFDGNLQTRVRGI